MLYQCPVIIFLRHWPLHPIGMLYINDWRRHIENTVLIQILQNFLPELKIDNGKRNIKFMCIIIQEIRVIIWLIKFYGQTCRLPSGTRLAHLTFLCNKKKKKIINEPKFYNNKNNKMAT